MAEQMMEPKTGLVDLEKELTCSICTEILYQPLSLIDCLHTFCGSCLKIWFVWQAAQNSHHSPHPFTCPSCRSTVLRTKHDAKVQTLVDMFLQANLAKAKKQEEVEDIRKKYTPGENVLQITGSGEPEDDEDRRMVEEARAISLQEAGLRSGRTLRSTRTYERGIRHEARSRDERRHEHYTAERTAELESQAQQIEHQPSLRSLISNSDLHSAEMQEEILRQITDEGLLDGIDLNNMDIAQEDELSERIAEAYRRRHRPRARAAHHHSENRRAEQDVPRSPDHRSRRAHSRSLSAEHMTAAVSASHSSSAQRSPRHVSPSTPSHPPVSRPHFLEARPTGSSHPRRRTASEGRRQTSPMPTGNTIRGEATRSATDLSNRPRSSEMRTANVAATRDSTVAATRDSTNATTRQTIELRPRRLSSESMQRQRVPPLATSTQIPACEQPPYGTSSPAEQRIFAMSPIDSPNIVAVAGPPLPIERTQEQRSLSAPSSTDVHQVAIAGHGSSNVSQRHMTIYTEPSISCERCGRNGIQYELHERCSVCKEGNYHLCHLCYRRGEGCLLWYGFGTKAWRTFQSQAGIDPQLPHTLTGQKYGRPLPESVRTSPPSASLTTTSDPATRFESGVFCSLCSALASDCFWLCPSCNEGEWGFCSACVDKGHHCTHSLLPITAASAASGAASPLTSRQIIAYPICNLGPSGQYRALAPQAITCASCSKIIPPQDQRQHCPTCSSVDADLCLPCYARLAAAGTVEPTWRRCPRGHRTVMIRFIDTALGWRREVVRDRAGGCALREEGGASAHTDLEWRWREGDGEERQYLTISKAITSPSIPTTTTLASDFSNVTIQPEHKLKSPRPQVAPDGGVGMRAIARHGWWPSASASDDDLMFPRGAEIREVEIINDDWYWGCYCGFSGTFPASYVRVLGEDEK